MQKSLLIKSGIVLVLALLLAVPLGMVDQLVSERQARQYQVVNEIASSSATSQRIVGPLLAMPYTEEYNEAYWTEEQVRGKTKRVRKTRVAKSEGVVYMTAKEADMTFQGGASIKRRGLFKALVFDMDGTIQGQFELSGEPEIERHQDDSRVTWGPAYVSIGISDPRGIIRTPTLDWGGTQYAFEQGTRLGKTLSTGIHANLPSLFPSKSQKSAEKAPEKAPATARVISFKLDLSLRGTEAISFVPIADSNRVSLSSSWPHPSFQGRFLPNADTQRIDAQGFSATWDVSGLATTAPDLLLEDIVAGRSCTAGCRDWLGVRFIEPVNVYSMADRALKYGLLFIALSFAAFFLFEQLKALRIHPAQYLLVGLALALFFLLLLSLSEHMPFSQAYAIAATACVGLQTFYLSYVLHGVWRGLSFGGLLGALFGALYSLLVSEDVALLLGSGLLFALLALAMVLTRKLDWYRLETNVG